MKTLSDLLDDSEDSSRESLCRKESCLMTIQLSVALFGISASSRNLFLLPKALIQVSLVEALLVYTLAGQACKNLNLI